MGTKLKKHMSTIQNEDIIAYKREAYLCPKCSKKPKHVNKPMEPVTTESLNKGTGLFCYECGELITIV